MIHGRDTGDLGGLDRGGRNASMRSRTKSSNLIAIITITYDYSDRYANRSHNVT